METPIKKSNKCKVQGCNDRPVKIIGDCRYCNEKYCGKHRLPEAHLCANMSTCREESASKLASKVLESTKEIMIAGGKSKIMVYRLADHQMRIIFVDVGGPLVSASIIVPTVADNHKGLPHTLEHLVFCGSKSFPYRGYLDNLASRCLSTGTNAYTSEDHTCYEIQTAGAEGMANIFPVFLDHILHPTLRDRQFLTEVYHIDGYGKDQGVVYCEMASREYTEADLLDLELRRLIYNGESTYSFECGGLTKDIATLSNSEVINYHEKFYHLDNMAAVICGKIEPEYLFESLNKFQGLLESTTEFNGIMHQIQISPLQTRNSKSTVKFPSSENQVGSIAYGWRGPKSEDFEELVALTVLFRFLQETPSSLLNQLFVEKESPLASYVDFDVKSYVETAIVLIFSGVPFNATNDQLSDMETDDEDEDSEDDFNDGDDEMTDVSGDSGMSVGEARKDLFDDNIYELLVRDALNMIVQEGFLTQEKMQETIDRHRRKIMEGLEEEPHEFLCSQIVPDIIRYFFGATSSDTLLRNGSPQIGTRSEIFIILEKLEKKGPDFWISLAKKWIIDSEMVEVKMVPDLQMAKNLSEKASRKQEDRTRNMGIDGLQKLAEEVKIAIEENKINIPEKIVNSMPSIPDVSKADSIKFETYKHITYESPFNAVQLVKTETLFTHCRLAFNIQSLPLKLRPYLVLFQELLYDSDIEYTKNGKLITLNYKQVSDEAARLFVSHEAAVGFGNDVWNSSWLSEVFMLYANTEEKNWKRAFEFLCEVFLFTKFEKNRIVTVASNLLKEIAELKRDGGSMLVALSTRVCFSNRLSMGCNDLEISVFKQEAFLKNILNVCKSSPKDVISSLNDLRRAILQADGPGFAQFTVPLQFSESDSTNVINSYLNIWKESLDGFSKSLCLPRIEIDPFPFDRKPFQITDVHSSFSSLLVVPISGLGASFLFQVIPCDVINSPDYLPLALLVEVLSRCEGALYSSIRGQGYAYGAHLSIVLWTGQLCFELMDASEPVKGLMEFYSILNSLKHNFSSICTQYELETARASLNYRFVSERATGGGIISQSLRSALRGTDFLEVDSNLINLQKVALSDLKRVFSKYLVRFLNPKERFTFVTTSDGEKGKTIQKSFVDNGFTICSMALKDFDIIES